jgi:hypothetical protein
LGQPLQSRSGGLNGVSRVAVETHLYEEVVVMSKSEITYPDRKISDTLLQFAEPLLDGGGPDANEAQMKQSLMIAWTVWNAVVYADVVANNQPLKSLRASTERDPQIKSLTEQMIDRKRTLFGDDQRLIGEYELYRKGGELRLRAEARSPSRKGT